ncbi:hypothetical protein [Helicobacter sp.]|uniref:hypothetical protein n=1 Tax=Helicobacter sp. TaxID=218 RepID=UPI0025C5871A|nr:hypothetical protein [Helicobacter sp.]MBR2494922.1 hypothetical protein [Helicobacter sp.]
MLESKMRSSICAMMACVSLYSARRSRAFVMLEIVFALVVIGVAFGILAQFYLSRFASGELPIAELDIVQEKALQELESKIAPKSHIILGKDGLFCEGELFSTTQSQSTFKLFVPRVCDKPKFP